MKKFSMICLCLIKYTGRQNISDIIIKMIKNIHC